MQTNNLSAARQERRESYVYIGLSIAAVLGLIALSFLPGQAKQALHTTGRLHPYGHLAAFAVIGYLTARVSKTPGQRVLFFIGSLAFGIAIEFCEHFIYGTVLETHDIGMDMVGVLLGTGIALLISKPVSDSVEPSHSW